MNIMNTMQYKYVTHQYAPEMVEYDTITIHYGQKFYFIIIGQPYHRVIWHYDIFRDWKLQGLSRILYHFNQLDSHRSQARVFCLRLVLVSCHRSPRPMFRRSTVTSCLRREFGHKTSLLTTIFASFAHVHDSDNPFSPQIIHFWLSHV